jgi:hypothetical protein
MSFRKGILGKIRLHSGFIWRGFSLSDELIFRQKVFSHLVERATYYITSKRPNGVIVKTQIKWQIKVHGRGSDIILAGDR